MQTNFHDFFRFLRLQIKRLEMHFATVSLRFPAESIEIDWLARVSRSRSFKWCYFPCHCELQFEQKKKSWGRGRCMQFLLTNWLIFRLCLSSQVPPLTWINISWNWNKNSHEHFKTTHVEQSKVSKALAFPFVCQRKALLTPNPSFLDIRESQNKSSQMSKYIKNLNWDFFIKIIRQIRSLKLANFAKM